VSDIISF